MSALAPIRVVAGIMWLISWLTFGNASRTATSAASSTGLPWFEPLRQGFTRVNHGLSRDASALVSGMAIGDAHNLSSALKAQMQSLSLTHLVAVSGSNCAIVGGVVLISAGRLGLSRWLRSVAAIAALCAYVGLVGPQPSVLRAAVMATAVLLAKALGRATRALDSLALAVATLIAIDPRQGASLGFSLSVAATIGILVLAPAMARRLETRMPRWLALSVSVSVSAQLLCTPLLLGLQGGIPVWSVLANLLAEPMVAPCTILGLIAVLLGIPLPQLASAIAWVASIASQIVCQVAENASRLPVQLIPWPVGFAGQLAIVTGVISALGFVHARRRSLATLGLAIGIGLPILIGMRHNATSAHWPGRDWAVANCDVGQGDGLVLRSRGKIMVIDVGRDPQPIGHCLNQLGINEVNLLELTHFDLDHVGGLSGLLAAAKVDQAILTSFSDSRPGADATRRELEANRIPIAYAGVGMVGTLGDFDWRVITPTLGASEAVDSNDGSIGMFFSSPAMCLITLADLGADGQGRLLANKDSWFEGDCRTKPIVLKVGHHGSANQSPEFTNWLRPAIALISVGLGNRYGHPTPSCLQMLATAGAEVWRTDTDGALALATGANGLTMTVSGRG